MSECFYCQNGFDPDGTERVETASFTLFLCPTCGRWTEADEQAASSTAGVTAGGERP